MSLSQIGSGYVTLKKRKKTSGLTGLELRMALTALRSVKANLKDISAMNDPNGDDDSQSQDDLISFGTGFEQLLDQMLEMMESKIDRPQALSFSGMQYEHLTLFNIKEGGSIQLKEDHETRAAAMDRVGTTEHWSSEGLNSHLKLLQQLVPKTNEAAARIWIEPFFFRSAMLLPPGDKMVLSLEQNVPATHFVPSNFTTVGGFIDYTAITASERDAKAFMRHPILEKLTNQNNTLFVLEAKSKNVSLEDHVPQAVCEMYACAKKLGKNIIRGALTNGHDWIFIVLKMHPDGNGGVYAESEKVSIMAVVPLKGSEISPMACSAIAGIIAHWIEHSNEEIGDDDWFSVTWR